MDPEVTRRTKKAKKVIDLFYLKPKVNKKEEMLKTNSTIECSFFSCRCVYFGATIIVKNEYDSQRWNISENFSSR